MRRRVILVAVLTFILVLASPQSACSSESSQPYWLVDSEEDWYEGDMVYSFCNDTDALHFTGEKVLFEDGFTWTVEEDAPWTILRIDKNKDEILDMKLDSNPAPSMIKFEASGAVPKGDTIRLVLWGDDSVESPIDISKHAYEVIWKVRLNVDEGMDLWEILIIVNRSDRILYDYGGTHVRPYRDQISYKKGENLEHIKFEHWGNMFNSRWNTGKIYFDNSQFIAYNDRYGDDDSSDGNLGGFYKEAEATEQYRDWGLLDSGEPEIWILAEDKGHGEQFWLDYFKVVQVDETVSHGFYTSKVWDSGRTRNWSKWDVFVDGSGDYKVEFGKGDGVFYGNLSDVADSSTLQFRITMEGNTVIDSVKIARSS